MNNDILGNIYNSNKTGKFKVIKLLYNTDKNKFYEVEFLQTGTKKVASKSNIMKGKLKDKHYNSILGIAKLGDIKPEKSLYGIWRNILNRCYNEKDKWYKSYGGKGVSVCNEWLCYSNFHNDVSLLSGYDESKIGKNLIELDKDFLQKNIDISQKIYSPKTCIWIDKSVNRAFTPTKQYKIKVTKQNGEVIIYNTIKECENDLNTYKGAVYQWVNNCRESKTGFKFEKIYN